MGSVTHHNYTLIRIGNFVINYLLPEPVDSITARRTLYTYLFSLLQHVMSYTNRYIYENGVDMFGTKKFKIR